MKAARTPGPTARMRSAPAGACSRTSASISWRRRRSPTPSRLAATQYQAADNMTDRMAALATLSLHDVPERKAAFDDFYQRYRDDPLIIDKWFVVAGDDPRSRDARPRARAHRASGILDGQSQPRALADRRFRARQSDAVQPAPTARATNSWPTASSRSIRTIRRSLRG